ncbi:MAG: ribonuclease P protein component [Alphaproteobacteria bacterium]
MGAAPERLKQRREFLRIARSGRKWVTPGLILQAGPHMYDLKQAAGNMQAHPKTHPKTHPDSGSFRIGFTVSRKCGGAVVRNRIKRRLRAAVDSVMTDHAAPENDYVVIGRAASAGRAFDDLSGDLETALRRLDSWRESSAG